MSKLLAKRILTLTFISMMFLSGFLSTSQMAIATDINSHDTGDLLQIDPASINTASDSTDEDP